MRIVANIGSFHCLPRFRYELRSCDTNGNTPTDRPIAATTFTAPVFPMMAAHHDPD